MDYLKICTAIKDPQSKKTFRDGYGWYYKNKMNLKILDLEIFKKVYINISFFLMGVIEVEENYSIQAKNLLDNLIDEYKNLVKEIHKIDILLKQIKGIRVEVNKRTRWISEISNISKDVANRKVKILIYNEEYLNNIKEELNELNLDLKSRANLLKCFNLNFHTTIWWL